MTEKYEKYHIKGCALPTTSADDFFWTFEQAVSYYQFAVVNYIGLKDKGMVLAGGCGDTNGKPQIDKTDHLHEAYEALFLQAEAELADIIWSDYDDVIFVSKSIGTIIAASYAEKYELSGARHILYTSLAQTFLFAPSNAIAFIGTADPWSNTDEIIQLSNTNNIPLTVYDGCNHSLECGNTLKNLEILKDVMQKTRDFTEKRTII